MKTLKLALGILSRKAASFMAVASALVMMSIPSFAAPIDLSTGVLPDDAFEPMVTAVTANIGSVLPQILVLAGLIMGIGLAIYLFKKFAK